MKLLSLVRKLVLEYIHPDAKLLIDDIVDGVEVKVWRSPHPDELRGDKKRIPEERVFMKLLQDSIEPIVTKFFKSGKSFRHISTDSKDQIRFAVRRIKGSARPQMIVQIDELNDTKIVLNIITFLDNEQDLYGINNTNKTRFIIDLGEKDLVRK
jgi:hypothetical protein